MTPPTYTRVVGVQQCRSRGKCLGASLLVNYGTDTKALVTYWLDESPQIREFRLTFNELFDRARSSR